MDPLRRADPLSRVEPLRRIWAVVRFVLERAIVEPIREGSLRRSPAWPRHLLPIVVVALIVYVLMTALAVLAGWVRRTALVQYEDISIPWLAIPPLLMAITFVLAAAYAAALHVTPWVRVPAVLVVLTVATQNPLLSPGPLALVMTVEIVVLVGFAALRWRRSYSPWEMVVALAVIGTGLAARLQLAYSGVESFTGSANLVTLAMLFSMVLMWATPSILMAGAAMAEITISTASWGARGAWEAVMAGRHARPVGAVLLALLVAGGVATGAQGLGSPENPPRAFLSAGLLLVSTAALGLGVLRFVPRGDRPGVQVDPDDLVQTWPGVSLPIAAAFTLGIHGPFPASQAARWWGLSLPDDVGMAGEVILLPLALVVAYWLARRTRPAAAVIVTAVGVQSAYVPLANRAGLPVTTETLLAMLVVAALAVLAYLLIARRLSADRGLAVGSVLLVAIAYPFREYLDEPFSLLATVSGTTGALLVGMAWRQLTEYGFTRRDSRAFPASSRVLLGTANLTLVASGIAMYAAAAASGVMSLGTIENVGDEVMGGSLLYAVGAAGLLLGVRGREGGDARAGEEFAIFPLLVEEKGPLQPWLDQNVGQTRWR